MNTETIIKIIQDNLFNKSTLPENLSFKSSFIPFEYPPETPWERNIRESIGDWL